MRTTLLRATMATTKVPVSALPLPATTHILTHNLTPDPQTPSAKKFREVLLEKPSIQRRARLVDPSAHFSHLTPLTLPFPYQITPPEGEEIIDKSQYVEDWLSSHEALDERPLAPTKTPGVLKKYSKEKRDMKREIIGLSDTGLRDTLPLLAVGDAFVEIGPPALKGQSRDEVAPKRPVSGEDKAIREELVDILSGHSVLMNLSDEGGPVYAPWSLRYSGHQFGTWAGQLGDGRAISIYETPHPSDPALTYELQLKGAGRTPYSRTADGLAVLRSSIREYLCAEAMHALHIPTTRSLAIVHLPDLDVIREEVESASIVTRIAPSFIRIGSFEALNPSQSMFFFGGGQQDGDLEALRILGEWVSRKVLRLGLAEGKPWGKSLVMESARRNARMVAGWQVYGFMHGVINTDNVSILGLTIDYGPYAFMDIFDPMHICNHSDSEGRYAYKFQPTMIVYALRALLNALSPIIGFESENGSAPGKGWSKEISDEKIKEWKEKGLELDSELKTEIETVFEKEYWHLYRRRLGLKVEESEDPDKIVRPLLDVMSALKLDFHSTFRRLCFFRPSILVKSDDLDAFIESLLEASRDVDREEAPKVWKPWLEAYAQRIEREKESRVWGDDAKFDQKREREMKKANPRFVLRQWVLEEIIARVKDDPDNGKRALAKIHEMATNPFEPWGAEGDPRPVNELEEEEREERRVCGLGANKMLGFQCSCSS